MLLSMEAWHPYSPMSLPYLISERVKQEDIRMVPDDFFDQMSATFVREARVVGIDTSERKVCLNGQKAIHYDRLLIATGSDPVVPAILQEAGCIGFHVMDDCLALIQQLQRTKKVTILGAGLVAMELAAALRGKGHDIHVIAPRERILRTYFDTEASGRIIELFAAAGVTIELNWGEAVMAEGSAEGISLRFSQGKSAETEILLSCMGVKPRVSCLADSGIAVNGGIVVDSNMRTNIPEIFAAGDVAEAKNFFTGQRGLNPILPNAASQGKIAGSNMADHKAEYEGWLPMNTFNFFGHLATSVGEMVPSPGDEELVEKHNAEYRKMIFRGGTIVGAAFIDTQVDAGVIQYLIRKKIEIGEHKEMLLKAPREVGFWLMNEAEKRETISMEQ
jgi:phenylglyoxylate dehydrogenase epsilon subunit